MPHYLGGKLFGPFLERNVEKKLVKKRQEVLEYRNEKTEIIFHMVLENT